MTYSATQYTAIRKEHPRLWRIWYRMCRRCKLPQKGYADVGVDENWDYYTIGSAGFVNFFDDMIDGYRDDLELDRINVFGDYTKHNLRWTTRMTNNNNKRWHHGEMSRLNDLRKKNGINRHTYYARLGRGWNATDAATLPPSRYPYKSRKI